MLFFWIDMIDCIQALRKPSRSLCASNATLMCFTQLVNLIQENISIEKIPVIHRLNRGPISVSAHIGAHVQKRVFRSHSLQQKHHLIEFPTSPSHRLTINVALQQRLNLPTHNSHNGRFSPMNDGHDEINLLWPPKSASRIPPAWNKTAARPKWRRPPASPRPTTWISIRSQCPRT